MERKSMLEFCFYPTLKTNIPGLIKNNEGLVKNRLVYCRVVIKKKNYV